MLLGSALIGSAATIALQTLFGRQARIRQPITTDYAVGDAAFTRVVSQLLSAPLVEGNQVTALQNGEESFPAMLAGIRSARRTVTFENFLWNAGTVTDQFASALVERAGAGVKVHFLQDALSCFAPFGHAIGEMRQAGVEVELFRRAHPLRLNNRSHNKLLVIDGQEGYIGGSCLSDDWQGDGQTAKLWRDSHYRVHGPAVAQLQRAFMAHWIEQRGEVLQGEGYFPQLERCGDDCCQVVTSSAGDRFDSARLMLLLSIAAARHSIRIANAFFIPDNLVRDALLDALRRGVHVEVVVPGQDLDAQTPRSVGKARWRPLLEGGACFYEYQPARYHCKYLTVDDCWSSVGSANLDDRALVRNEEANLNVLSRRFAAAQVRVFERDKSRSREITLDGWRSRPAHEKIRGAAGALLRSQI
jgi:cardiolipin synthase